MSAKVRMYNRQKCTNSSLIGTHICKRVHSHTHTLTRSCTQLVRSAYCSRYSPSPLPFAVYYISFCAYYDTDMGCECRRFNCVECPSPSPFSPLSVPPSLPGPYRGTLLCILAVRLSAFVTRFMRAHYAI